MSKTIYMDDIYKMIELLPDEKQNAIIVDTDECTYTNEDGDHCIAGQIISMLGFQLPDVDSYNNSLPIRTLLESVYTDKFDDNAIEMLFIGQSTADRLTHNEDPLAWGFAKRDMINFFTRTRKEEIAQRNLQAGY
jgi:hypothetical protein